MSQVVRLDDAVAIVAAHTWAAKQGLAAAAPQWDAGPNAKLSTADIVAAACRGARRSPGPWRAATAMPPEPSQRAARKVDAVYQQPFLAHATMEPMNCTVRMTRDGCDIWVGTQIPGITQAVGHESHRAEARAGSHPQPSARRRVRAPPRVRRHGARRADRAAGRGAGPGDLDARGRHPARHVSAVLLRPLERRRGRTGQGGSLVASHHRLVDHRALFPRLDQGRSGSRRGRKLGESAVRHSGTFMSTGSRRSRRPEFKRVGGAVLA